MNGNMFRKINETIHYHLETELGITASRTGDERCRELMEEDDTIGEKRRRLKEEKNKLAAFARELSRLMKVISEMDSAPEVANGDSDHFEGLQNSHLRGSNESEGSEVHVESMDLDGIGNDGPSAYSDDLPGPEGELF
jgi:hypothetical protein